jgi:hypothetical protein
MTDHPLMAPATIWRPGNREDRMRIFLLAGTMLALAACGGNNEAANDMNVMADENMMMDQNMMDPNMMDPNMMDPNAMNMDANGTVDANTQNMMMQDATTNDPDTNLANGM